MQHPHEDISNDEAAAMALAESLAKSYSVRRGSVSDLFAAFVGIVVRQNKAVGFAALDATDRYLAKKL